MSRTAASFIVVVLCIAGCNDQNANYCADAPHHNCMDIDAAVPGCTSDQACAPNVCDLGTQMCVQCTSANPAACIATTPVCGTDDTCHGCTSHAQCGSSACLADGSCAAEDTVAYVAPGGTGTCDKGAPCGTLDAALQTGRPYVKFDTGVIKDNKTTTIDGKTVTILAEAGAQLDRDGDGAILVVQSTNATPPTNVQIFDLEITGATGIPGGDAIHVTAIAGTPSLSLTHVTIDNNQGVGVTATAGALSVSRSVFSKNAGGGISANGSFKIVGNAFIRNGATDSLGGAIVINSAKNDANRLDFNSFYGNSAQTGIGQAIDCRVSAFIARNNIMSGNGTLDDMNQYAGTCTHMYSIARPGTPLPGATNSTADPLFVDIVKGDLHLQATSTARGAADPNSDLTGIASQDIDGTSRTAPATIGAYQLKPQGTP